MIHAVVDVNVLASGFSQPGGPPDRVIRAWLAGSFTLIYSIHIESTLRRTLAKPYFARRLTQADVDAIIELLRSQGTLTPLTHTVSGIAPDAEDDLVLSTALSGNATYLVTGDRAFRRLGAVENVSILTPQEFLAVLADETTEP